MDCCFYLIYDFICIFILQIVLSNFYFWLYLYCLFCFYSLEAIYPITKFCNLTYIHIYCVFQLIMCSLCLVIYILHFQLIMCSLCLVIYILLLLLLLLLLLFILCYHYHIFCFFILCCYLLL